jgi:hypothetical protein
MFLSSMKFFGQPEWLVSFEDLEEGGVPETYVPLFKACMQYRGTIQTTYGEGEIVLGNNGVEVLYSCINELNKAHATYLMIMRMY